MSESAFFTNSERFSGQEKPVVVFIDDEWYGQILKESEAFQSSFHDISPLITNDKSLRLEAMHIFITADVNFSSDQSGTVYLSCRKKAEGMTFGYQRHFSPYESLNLDLGQVGLSLGRMRSYPDLVEPVMRDVSKAVLYADAIRYSDIGSGYPTGFTSEEVCEFARVLGEMTDCNEVHLLIPEEQKDSLVWIRMYLTVIWYITEGLALRKKDGPNTGESQTYIVTGESSDYHFVQSLSSGRWWMDLGHEAPQRWIPCHVSEYEQVKRGEVPWRLADYVI